MRPEGMATESPSSVQQSLTRKYKGVCLCAKLSTGGHCKIASPSPSLPLFPFLFPSLPPSLSLSLSPSSLSSSFFPSADAYAMELSSLKAVYQLVVHCCELLSLWKLLCEYQLHLTAKELTNVRKMRKKRRRKRKWF